MLVLHRVGSAGSSSGPRRHVTRLRGGAIGRGSLPTGPRRASRSVRAVLRELHLLTGGLGIETAAGHERGGRVARPCLARLSGRICNPTDPRRPWPTARDGPLVAAPLATRASVRAIRATATR